jgi:hypothetical protein
VEVTDDQAYWHGCATCRWELKKHTEIHDNAKNVLEDNEDDIIRKESYERTMGRMKKKNGGKNGGSSSSSSRLYVV